MKPFLPSRNTHGWRACMALLDGDMLATHLGATIGITDNHMPSALRHILRNGIIHSYRGPRNRLHYGLTPQGREQFAAVSASLPEDDAVPDMPVVQRRVCARSADALPISRDAILRAASVFNLAQAT
jgi:DNA-binding MarR family transcriptional regulator